MTPSVVDILPYLRHKADCKVEWDMAAALRLDYTLEQFQARYGAHACSCGLQELLFGSEGK